MVRGLRGEVTYQCIQCHGAAQTNNLVLNTIKTKEVILDFRGKKGADPPPIFINGDLVERVHSFKYLGIHISDDLTWKFNSTTTTKKATQRLYFPRLLKKSKLYKDLPLAFYRAAFYQSIRSYGITLWYAGCSEEVKKAIQRVIKAEQKIRLPPAHPGHHCSQHRAFNTPPTTSSNCFPPADATDPQKNTPPDSVSAIWRQELPNYFNIVCYFCCNEY